MHPGVFSSMPDLYPLDAHCAPSPIVTTKEMSPDTAQGPWGAVVFSRTLAESVSRIRMGFGKPGCVSERTHSWGCTNECWRNGVWPEPGVAKGLEYQLPQTLLQMCTGAVAGGRGEVGGCGSTVGIPRWAALPCGRRYTSSNPPCGRAGGRSGSREPARPP